jgi:hypothetical protein
MERQRQDRRDNRARPFIRSQDHNKRATPMIATKPHHYGYYTYDLTDASRRQCFCETPHMDYPNAWLGKQNIIYSR